MTLSRANARRIDEIQDRIDDRIDNAPDGLHVPRDPAEPEAVDTLGLSEENREFWLRWDGIEIGHGDCRVYSVEEIGEATATALEEDRINEGDLVVGERGANLVILCADPYDEGADIIVLTEGGDRLPEASTLYHFVLGLIAEHNIVYDGAGEIRTEMMDEESGELKLKIERKILRRRLDNDPDAPYPRFRLAQILREGGELKGAKSELKQVLRCAPNFVWASYDMGRVVFALGDLEGAYRVFRDLSKNEQSDAFRGLFGAWQARCSDEAQREKLITKLRADFPTFAASQEEEARAALEFDDKSRAVEACEVGLVVHPKHLGLLGLLRTLSDD